MQSKLNPYISFNGNAREAMEFYRSVFGGELTVSTFEEYHVSEEPGEKDKIMHAQLVSENGIIFMAADSPGYEQYVPGANISMSLSGDHHDELASYFEKLAEGGTIAVPLEQAPWVDTFGMLTDRFGINWMVNISPAQK
jgi:PhnB protein